MTPQERTELQQLAEQATPGPWFIERPGQPNHGWFIYSDAFPADDGRSTIAEVNRDGQPLGLENTNYIAAANPATILDLLSLAAQSEELRAELETMKWLHAEVEADFEWLSDKQADEGAARFEARIFEIVGNNQALESRYSALVKALKKVDSETLGGNCAACHGFGQDDNANFFCHECKGTGWMALGALLDSEASDQGVSDG